MSKPSAVTEPLLLSGADAAKLCSVSRTTWWRMNRSGHCPMPISLGSRVLWRRDELIAWIAADCPPRHRWQAIRKGGAA